MVSKVETEDTSNILSLNSRAGLKWLNLLRWPVRLSDETVTLANVLNCSTLPLVIDIRPNANVMTVVCTSKRIEASDHTIISKYV